MNCPSEHISTQFGWKFIFSKSVSSPVTCVQMAPKPAKVFHQSLNRSRFQPHSVQNLNFPKTFTETQYLAVLFPGRAVSSVSHGVSLFGAPPVFCWWGENAQMPRLIASALPTGGRLCSVAPFHFLTFDKWRRLPRKVNTDQLHRRLVQLLKVILMKKFHKNKHKLHFSIQSRFQWNLFSC